MGPRTKSEDDTECGALNPPPHHSPSHQHNRPRGPTGPRLCVIVSVPRRGGAARAVPLLLGDAALAAPRTTTGPPAASPRSSMPGGEPAYADRRQQGGTDSLMSRAAVVAPGSNRRQPALGCALGGQIRDGHKIRARQRAGITFTDYIVSRNAMGGSADRYRSVPDVRPDTRRTPPDTLRTPPIICWTPLDDSIAV
jgi:hypothetical protein